MSFRLVPKSVTLNDLEWRNGHYFALFERIRIPSGRTAQKFTFAISSPDEFLLSLVTLTFEALTLTFKLVRARDQTCLPCEFVANQFTGSRDISHTNKSHRECQKQNLKQFTVCCCGKYTQRHTHTHTRYTICAMEACNQDRNTRRKFTHGALVGQSIQFYSQEVKGQGHEAL